MSAKPCCLIVDDSEVIREIAERIIVDLGLDAAQAENAREAIEFCQQKAPEAVLLDWDLPSMGALDFLRGAAELEKRPEIILCATENDPQQFSLAKAAGAAHHILKPFDRTSIQAKLSEIGILQGAAAPHPIAANKG
ncbi:MAG: response regulator [Alphaproteobacteria bacterium]|nr:response regulator [Alphaproteobacteria bacterium]